MKSLVQYRKGLLQDVMMLKAGRDLFRQEPPGSAAAEVLELFLHQP